MPTNLKEIYDGIENCNSLMTSDNIAEIFRLIKDSDLSELERLEIFKKIETISTFSKAEIKRAYTSQTKVSRANISLFIASIVINECYLLGKGIMQTPEELFYAYNGRLWDIEHVSNLKRKILKKLQKHVNPDDHNYSYLIDEVVNLIGPMCAENDDVLGFKTSAPSIINTMNCEVLFKKDGSFKTQLHRPESKLTYLTPIEYDENAECPVYDDTILEIFSNSSNPDEMVRHWNEIMGYVIQPNRFVQKWLLCLGGGSNGKTSLCQLVISMLNTNACVARSIIDLEKQQFLIGHTRGSLLFYDDDVSTGIRLPDSTLKKLSENKFMTGELKHKDHFEFMSRLFLIMSSNMPPATADNSYGFVRRAMILPFDKTFHPNDKGNPFNYIKENEMSGVLNRAIEGLQRLIQRGEFDEPDDCKEALSKWLEKANLYVAFVKDCCDIKAGEQTTVSDFQSAFKFYCDKSNVKAPGMSPQRINTEMTSLGYEVDNKSGQLIIHGLRIKDKIIHGAKMIGR